MNDDTPIFVVGLLVIGFFTAVALRAITKKKIRSCKCMDNHHDSHSRHHGGDKDDKDAIIIKLLRTIMADIKEIKAKADALQAALDAEQEQILASVADLQKAVEDLKVLVADGGTAEERQAVADQLDAIKADLEATVPDQD